MIPARLEALGVGARAVRPPRWPGRGTLPPVGEPGLDAGGRTCRLRARERTSRRSWANWNPGTAISMVNDVHTFCQHQSDALDVPADLPDIHRLWRQAAHPYQESSEKGKVDVGEKVRPSELFDILTVSTSLASRVATCLLTLAPTESSIHQQLRILYRPQDESMSFLGKKCDIPSRSDAIQDNSIAVESTSSKHSQY